MDQLTVLRYAYRAALEDWDRAATRVQRNPRSEIQKAREAEASKAFNDIREMLLIEERKEAKGDR